MADLTFASGLSPLDQIRLAESEVTRKIVTAREVSEHTIAETRVRAALLKKQGHEAGTRDGQIRYKQIISNAEEEARMIVEQARKQADGLRQKGQARMDMAIQEVISIILGLKGDGN